MEFRVQIMKKFDLDGYFSEEITFENASRYDDVFLSNVEYFLVTDGREPTKNDCIDTVNFRIDGMGEDAFFNIGFSVDGKAIGCLFLIEGYPESDVLWIGLFIVHADHKRCGFGKKCFESLLEAYKGTEIKRIRLSVQDNNLSGFGFWKQVGFSIIDETDCGNFTNLTMEYVI